MAIAIKAIECPKCGSTQKTEIRPGDYQCMACGTEYFLDNGTVNFGRTPPTSLPPVASGTSAAKIILTVSLVFFVIILLIIGIASTMDNHSSQAGSPATTTKSDPYYYISNDHLYLSADKRPIFVGISKIRLRDNYNKEYNYIDFFDVAKEQEVARIPVPGAGSSDLSNTSGGFDLKEFSNGDIYILANSETVSQVKKGTFTATNVTKSLFAGKPELESGLAKIDFAEHDLGEGFSVFTNEGKNYFYFPLTDKLYTKDALDKMEQERRNSASSGSKSEEKVGFDFNFQSHDEGTDLSPAQLCTYRYTGKKGPFAYVLEQLKYSTDSVISLKQYGITSFSNFTPGRSYFEANVLYYDNDYVLVIYKLNPAKTAQRYIQCFNARTAAIVFTTKIDVPYWPNGCIRYADGFAMNESTQSNIFAVDMKGQLSKYKPKVNFKSE